MTSVPWFGSCSMPMNGTSRASSHRVHNITAHGHKWAGDDWAEPYLDAYAKVYPNLVKHDSRYPTPEYLQARTLLGNVKAEGEMDEVTAGSQRIVEVLLDESDQRPVWIQAWGGTNTIARALKTIEEQHPERMAEVAKKIRFYFIWEQDETYQKYIRPHWGKYGIRPSSPISSSPCSTTGRSTSRLTSRPIWSARG